MMDFLFWGEKYIKWDPHVDRIPFIIEQNKKEKCFE
jgi:hypothetical protein